MSSPVHAVHTIHGSFSGIPAQSYAGVVTSMPTWRVSVSLPPNRRRLPQPPHNGRRQPVHFPQQQFQDPFDDRRALVLTPTPTHISAPVPQRTRLASQSFTVKMPRSSHLEALVRQRTAQRLAQDREARCKAVAGILLNRVHAVGKPMRRVPPPNPEVPRTYKRSRLSTMVTVDDL